MAPQFENVTFQGANNDTRKLLPGQLFVALEGVRDGHDFIPVAMEKGAAAVLCKHCDPQIPAIVVEEPRLALGAIAAALRQHLDMQVVAVTGSVGKSTTKEMIASVLEQQYVVSKTPANHNNDIGMPMAILAMPEDTQVAVLEMGMNHFREIAYLTNIGRPDVAVIINVGTMHIEHLGSREGILQAKLEILEGMTPEGKVLLNGDNDMLWNWRNKADRPVCYFGEKNAECNLRALSAEQKEDGLYYQVAIDGYQMQIFLPLEGEHYICDSLAAVGVGLALGITPENIRKALAGFQNMEGRQQIFVAKGCTIIKDCYNAGPESMAAALKVLGRRGGRRIAVLGDMLELGDHSLQAHHQVGVAAAANADVVLAYGPFAPQVVQGARDAGFDGARAFSQREEMARVLRELTRKGDVLLFKGSHGMHMELVLDMFPKEEK